MLRALRLWLRLKRYWFWLVALALLGGALCFVPLFDLLGYEFCLALALAASLASAHLGSVFVAASRERDEGTLYELASPLGALLGLLGRALLLNLTLLLLPLGLISLNALRVQNCDYLEGLAFFGMMPALSVGCATSVGVLAGLALPRRALASALAVLGVLASLFLGVLRFYAEPPIFGYDPFAGYFPGSLYDEDVSIQPAFLWYRAYNLVWLAGIVLLAARLLDPATLRLSLRSWTARSRTLLVVGLHGCAVGVVLFLLRGHLGFAIDAGHIASTLGGTRSTAHFEIHHPAGLAPEEVELLAQDHELRYAQLAALFGTAPARITSFIFESPEQKRRLMGAGQTFIAKPWLGHVYLQQEPFPHAVLKHELAHVFAAQHGDPLFGVSLRWTRAPVPHPVFNVGLIEGIAVAADWRPHDELTVHQLAAAMIRLKLAPPAETLFGYGFLGGSAARSYTLAGSFCRYLIEQYGFRRLAEAYGRGGELEEVYGRSLKQLVQAWLAYLERVPVPEDQLQLAAERFRRPSILRRVCGHEVANLYAEARGLREERRLDEAAAVHERICRFDPDEPSHLVHLADALVSASRLDAALDAARRLARHPGASKPLVREALELEGDLLWRKGRDEAARAAYAAAARLAAPPFGRRVVFLKRFALEQTGDARRLLRDYLLPPPGKDREPGRDVHLAHCLARALPRSGIGMFLVGKQLAGQSLCREAIPALREGLALGLPHEDFAVEARLVLGRCLFVDKEHAAATQTYRALLGPPGSVPLGRELEVSDWLERITFALDGRVRSRGVPKMISDR